MDKVSIKLPKLLSEGCVLQQGKETRIWGWAEPEKELTIEFQEKSITTKSDKAGRFEGKLNIDKTGGPFTLKVSCENGEHCVVKEVYAGEVFVCSGQSNMELPMRRVKERYPEEFQAGGCEGVHLYKVKECTEFSGELEDHIEAAWYPCTGDNLEEISALSYFFGKYIYETKGAPVGILNLSLGGTPAEAWTSKDGLEEYPELLEIRKQYQSENFRKQIIENQEKAEAQWHQNLEQKNAEKESSEKWEKIQVPGYFADQGLKDFCGLLWMRKKFQAGKEWTGQKSLLRFGTLVDSDKMYINGKWIGETGYCYPPRRYEIPAGVLKEGENELLIHLICRDGKGRVTPGKDYCIAGETQEKISLEGEWEYEIRAVSEPAPEQNFINRKPTGLFQGMTAPCLPYTVQGVVWYQGESNDSRPETYEILLKGMIQDWRNRWQQEKLPFIVVQLPNCGIDIAPGDAWPILREAQSRAEDLPDTAVTVNLDLGEDNDLHPLNKKAVAYRAFLAAENLVYKKDIPWKGPVVRSVRKKENTLVLSFSLQGDSGLHVLEGQKLSGFEVQGNSGEFREVPAEIEGNTVILDCGRIKNVKRVRYAWNKTPGRNLLCSREGLPAGPFCREIL